MKKIDPHVNVIGQVVPMFLYKVLTNIEFVCVNPKTSEPLNRLRLFMDQFVHYIRGKVCRYQVLNIITQYAWKIMS